MSAQRRGTVLDAGHIRVYALQYECDPSTGYPSTPQKIDRVCCMFGDVSTHESEYYAAAGHDIKVDRRVRIWQSRAVRPGDRADIWEDANGVRTYTVGRVYHGLDVDGHPITELSLAALDPSDGAP